MVLPAHLAARQRLDDCNNAHGEERHVQNVDGREEVSRFVNRFSGPDFLFLSSEILQKTGTSGSRIAIEISQASLGVLLSDDYWLTRVLASSRVEQVLICGKRQERRSQ